MEMSEFNADAALVGDLVSHKLKRRAAHWSASIVIRETALPKCCLNHLLMPPRSPEVVREAAQSGKGAEMCWRNTNNPKRRTVAAVTRSEVG